MKEPNRTVFILGAGFDADAVPEASDLPECVQTGLRYPLASDLWGICFPDKPPQLDRSIEEAFAEALRNGNEQPVLNLIQRLFQCDYYIAGAMSKGANSYWNFLQRFRGAMFLTYNYDSLVEILLLRLGVWSPGDGYGIPVRFNRDPVATSLPCDRSLSQVLHLHGSLVLHPEPFIYNRSTKGDVAWREELTVPPVHFEPGSIGNLFGPYKYSRRIARERRLERISPPVPDKSHFLNGPYAGMILPKACEVVADAEALVAIGYSFSPHDSASFRPILEALALARSCRHRLLIVAPDAREIATRLTQHWRFQIDHIPLGFSAWVADGYPGL